MAAEGSKVCWHFGQMMVLAFMGEFPEVV